MSHSKEFYLVQLTGEAKKESVNSLNVFSLCVFMKVLIKYV
jgi:hypothetical protein